MSEIDILNDVVDIGTDIKDVADEEGTSDGARKGWITRRMGSAGTFEDQDELEALQKQDDLDDAGKKKLAKLEDRKQAQVNHDRVANQKHTNQVKIIDNLNDVDGFIDEEELKTLIPELSDYNEQSWGLEDNSLDTLVSNGKIEKRTVWNGTFGEDQYKAKDPNDSDQVTALKNLYGNMDYNMKYETNFNELRNRLDDAKIKDLAPRYEDGTWGEDDFQKITWLDAGELLDEQTKNELWTDILTQEFSEREVREKLNEQRTESEIADGVDYLKKSEGRGYSSVDVRDYDGLFSTSSERDDTRMEVLKAGGYGQYEQELPTSYGWDITDEKIKNNLSKDRLKRLEEANSRRYMVGEFLRENVKTILQTMIGSGVRTPDGFITDDQDSIADWEYDKGSINYGSSDPDDNNPFRANAFYLSRPVTDEEWARRNRKLSARKRDLPPTDLTDLPDY